jgi:hypothetical protein
MATEFDFDAGLSKVSSSKRVFAKKKTFFFMDFAFVVKTGL